MKRHVLLIMCCSLIYLTSCSKPAQILLYNNSGSDLEVRTDDGTDIIESGCSKRIKYPMESSLTIRKSSTVWVYKVNKFPPREFCEPTAAATIHAQIEADGRIYVFLPKTALPVEDLISQPDGFPLMPLESE